FRIKKTLIYFHKALTANREVVTSIEKQYLKHISKKELKEFRILYNDIVQLIDTCDTQRDVTTGVIDIYLSSVSNLTNDVVKKLTVIASFVLVPTLISGIYGMNFRIMPEIPWAYGYPFALGLMVFSVVAMWVYFKKAKWF
ncbi:MAG: magnesium and cobalt transport protein CorA, partial [Candidatus Bathyarchaeota archaeon]|nr:magnesium and cobalt transport protein CorA [Candidatus Bathyarchaeota archaeon]